MSRIYDALKRAQREKASRLRRASERKEERREVRRFELQVAIFVYGHAKDDEPFHEEAISLVVNSNGALLLMANAVIPGQKLLVTNPSTHAEQPCRVVHLRESEAKRVEVGVAFDARTPDFWPVPADMGADLQTNS